ncbi:MAG: Hint domain-containing protein, partial [Rhodobacteraceae bacterium]|nr:Hint domain-containing protein [Paracoccaceae bacterium]
MPTTYTDQFFIIDPFSPPPVGTAMNFVNYDLIDQNDDDDFDRFDNDSVNGSDITSSFPGDTVTINVPGVGNVTYTGVTFYLADGTRVFTPDDGQALQNGTFVSSTWVSGQGPLDVSDLGPTCFTSGTMIQTVDGTRLIEELEVSDLVMTRDHGPKPILWISRRSHPAKGMEAPVLIHQGALGNNADLLVSQQHRMLISGWRAELYLGVDEALIAAKHLVNDKTIRIVEGGE